MLRHQLTTLLFHWSHIVRYVAVIMSAKTKRALRKKRYLDKKDVSQLYMKEYRESNRNAIRESQNKYYEQNKDVMKFGVRKHYEQNKDAKKLSVQQHYEQNKDAKNWCTTES